MAVRVRAIPSIPPLTDKALRPVLEAIVEQIEVFLGYRAGDQAALGRLLGIISTLEERIAGLETAAEIAALGDRIQGFVNASCVGSSMAATGGIDRYGSLAAAGGADTASMTGFNMQVNGTAAVTTAGDTSSASGTVT